MPVFLFNLLTFRYQLPIDYKWTFIFVCKLKFKVLEALERLILNNMQIIFELFSNVLHVYRFMYSYEHTKFFITLFAVGLFDTK